MPYLTLKLSKRPAASEIALLQQELGALAEVREASAESFDLDLLTPFVLMIGFSANLIQIVDILKAWFPPTAKGNRVAIRLSDGREFRMEATTDPEVFIQQVRAALKDF